jgi:hypothetical protein
VFLEAFCQANPVSIVVGRAVRTVFSYEYITAVRPMTGLRNGFDITLMELEADGFSAVVTLCKVWP